MVKKIKRAFRIFFSQRAWILLAVLGALSCILIVRIFNLQIINGEEYAENFTVKITKERNLKSTRGNIYDCNGNLLAYNELSNSVTLEDSGSYDTYREKNLTLNGEIYKLIKMIEANGDSTSNDFHIYLDANGDFQFDCDEGITRNRFRADVFGYQTIDEMTAEEASATADDIMAELSGADRFAIYNEENPYTTEELEEHGLPVSITKDEQLKIVIIRYLLSLTSYQKYLQVTIASNVSDETVAAIEENMPYLEGVDIQEDSIRVYNDAEALAPIIGYTGSPSAEELETLSQERDDYTSSSIIGKSGIEQYMETTLQGYDGSEEVTVDNLGKVLAVNAESRVDPIQGNDVYLTIDSELQVACYQILEQRIAGILVSNIAYVKTLEDTNWDSDSTDPIPIPIYDVYNALINNSVIDITHFTEPDASELEVSIEQRFESRQQEILDWLSSELNGISMTPYEDLSDEQKAYMDYLVDDLLTDDKEILNDDVIDENDTVYRQWVYDETISVRDYLTYAASQNWLNVTQLTDEDSYLNSSEVYSMMVDSIPELLREDSGFSKLVYKYMLLDDLIYPEEIISLLYQQGVLSVDDGAYDQFISGTLTPSELIVSKISNLEITPKQLALDPCSGSIVIIDPESGNVKALVTYPGYDNNRLANQMDTEYYRELYNDLSTPFYNKATQQLTAPGSTFKMVTTAAGLNEGVIDNSSLINCNGLFGEGLVETSDQIRCSLRTGHGDLDVVNAIAKSCNVYFCTVGYMLGLNDEGVYVSNDALEKIQAYANMFNLNQKTNIELTESSPQVSDSLPLPSAIGQGQHLYTTTQLARYAATIENNGTSYDLTLLDKVTDSDGNTIQEYDSVVSNETDLPDYIWDTIHTGMRSMVQQNDVFTGFQIEVYGKTGTAEESANRPSHALFVGYAKDSRADDIAFAVRVAYGYSSTNAAVIARDMLNYYYNAIDETEVLTGSMATDDLNNVVTD